MRTGWLGTVFLCAAGVGFARGQTTAPPFPLPTPTVAETPPLVLPSAPDLTTPIPNGTPVSRPLQPVIPGDVPPDPAETPSAPTPPLAEAAGVQPPLSRSWDSVEFLLWWAKPQSLPPLVTGSRTGALPVLGGPNTVVLAGGRSADSQPSAGMRITMGWAVNDEQTAGVEATYLFLGTRTATADYSDLTGGRYLILGRPFINAVTGREDVVPFAYPGIGNGLVTVSTSNRVTGWEVGGVGNLYAGPRARVNVTAGYRYFMANEGLRVEQTAVRFPLPTAPEILATSADQFDAHNRFHGGQIGVNADLRRGPLFIQVVGKVAFGGAIEVASVSGQTAVVTGGNPIPLIQSYNAGVLGLPSNAGRVSHAAFAVLPEAQLKIGCKLGEYSNLYIGYNFLFLSQAIRAGDQIDRTLNPAQIPTLSAQAPAAAILSPDRPQVVMTHGDFWVQGLLVGMEWRY